MLMTKGLDSKILYSILIVSGFVLTIGAASAVVMYSENIELDNGTADSSIKVTSSTGDSKVILEDQGGHTWSLMTADGINKFQITDETLGKTRFTIKQGGQIGIGTDKPGAKLHVVGKFKATGDSVFVRNLDVGGVITGPYIASLEATIADLEARILALEGAVPINQGDISVNAGDISDNVAMLLSHDAAIESLEEGVPPQGNPCNPDGDGGITAQEMLDHVVANGANWLLSDVISMIGTVEGVVGSPMENGILDTAEEVNQFNGQFLILNGLPACVFP